MNRKRIKLIETAALTLALLMVPTSVNAMHIMEGYLPAGYCVAWGLICLPFLFGGIYSVKKRLQSNPRTISLFAMSGAFIFVISSLKLPSITGSCSHMTGTGLGAILFGPVAVSVLGLIVLLFQAILLAHGGLTTLGANTFSMAVAGPFLAYFVYRICCRLKVNRKVSVFLAAFLGDMATYCVTSLQMALAYPAQDGSVAASAVKFLGVFAPTQLPLAVIEGLLTVVIIIGLEAYARPELGQVGYLKEE